MKKNNTNPVLITIKGKDSSFVARVPLWKAYFILADLEKHQNDIQKLQEKREKLETELTLRTKKRKAAPPTP